jgi:hypothetical protein
MHEPYTFGISEIEAKSRFGNSFFGVKNCHHLKKNLFSFQNKQSKFTHLNFFWGKVK